VAELGFKTGDIEWCKEMKEYKSLVNQAKDVTPKSKSSYRSDGHHRLTLLCQIVWKNMLPKLHKILPQGRAVRLADEDKLRTASRQEEISILYTQFVEATSTPANPSNSFPHVRDIYTLPHVVSNLLKDNTVPVTEESWSRGLDEVEREVMELQIRTRAELVEVLNRVEKTHAAEKTEEEDDMEISETPDTSIQANTITQEQQTSPPQTDAENLTVLSKATSVFSCNHCFSFWTYETYATLIAHPTTCREITKTTLADFGLHGRALGHIKVILAQLGIDENVTQQEMESFDYICLRCSGGYHASAKRMSWKDLVRMQPCLSAPGVKNS
jgi:hypothetical protein